MIRTRYLTTTFVGVMILLQWVLADLKTGQFSDSEIAEVVGAHNYFRRLEGAAYMNKIKWNDTLALMAYNYVLQCSNEHGQPDTPESPFAGTGQNIYLKKPFQRLAAMDVVKKWYDEKQNYNFDDQSCKGECGHYTQVVWGDTIYVGCAVKNCTLVLPNKIVNATLYICNYGPGGNYPGMNPYEPGTPCEMCSLDTPCDDGLCDADY